MFHKCWVRLSHEVVPVIDILQIKKAASCHNAKWHLSIYKLNFVFSNHNIVLKKGTSATCTYEYKKLTIIMIIIIIWKKTKLPNLHDIVISTILIKHSDNNQPWNIGHLNWSYPSAKLLISITFQNVNQQLFE